MTIRNSVSRITKRRKVALVNREKNLVTWKQEYANTPDGPRANEILAKVKLCENEISILKKHVGVL